MNPSPPAQGSESVATLRATVAEVLRAEPRVVLAVSGGRDSMVLLDAAAHASRDRVAVVATFDHGTGPAAERAARLVARRAAALDLPFVRGQRDRHSHDGDTEAAWRDARWEFLRGVAASAGAPVATAHTADDQVETVLMRIMRGAGARGLAGLAARGEVVRPLLAVSRAAVQAYARARRLRWVEDPANRSPRFLRSRIRHDLGPALECVRPGFGAELIALGARAATLREDIERWIDRHFLLRRSGTALVVGRAPLAELTREELALLWPAIAARISIVLDRRGTRRLATFTLEGRDGARIPLSGGHDVLLHRGSVVLRRREDRPRASEAPLELSQGVSIGCWHFRLEPGAGGDLWSAELPADRRLWVRVWRPGDRMVPFGSSSPRRVKGLLRDAGIAAPERRGWPVVGADDELVWVPGVRRGGATVARSGGPTLLVRCERAGS